MKPVVTGVALEYRDTFTFAKLDVNTQRKKTVEYHIRGTPTYIVFKEGEMIARFLGAMPRAQLVAQIISSLGIEEPE